MNSVSCIYNFFHCEITLQGLFCHLTILFLVYPTYKGHFPPNRFNVKPGYRWDGVNRSNGFEDKMARRQNDAEARSKIAYKLQAELNE